MKRIILAIVALMSISLSGLPAQEIEANVTVNLEQLEFETRRHVSAMERDVERYINNQRFLSGDWEGEPIPVDITIVLSGGVNQRFTAQMFLVSRRYLDGPEEEPRQSVELKIMEKKWSFPYGQGASLTYNHMRYDEFTSLIDFYMLLIIGFDLDTYGELAGDEAYNKAENIASLGASRNAVGFSRIGQPGEFTKFNLINEITDLRYETFRKLIFDYYFNGMDVIGFDTEKGKQGLAKTIADMAAFKRDKVTTASVLMQAFFDSKSEEIADIFNGYEDQTVFDNLFFLDPGHARIYQLAKEGDFK